MFRIAVILVDEIFLVIKIISIGVVVVKEMLIRGKV